MEVTVCEIEKPDCWDKELADYQASIFLSAAWLQSVATSWRVPVYFIFLTDDQEIARISGLKIIALGGKLKLLFFYSGILPVVRDNGMIEKCSHALLDYAREKRISRIIIRSYGDRGIVQSGITAFKTNSRVEYIISMEGEKEMILAGFHRNARRAVRKAISAGIKTGITSSPEFVDILFALLSETRQRRKKRGYGDYNAMSLPFFTRSTVLYLLKNNKASLFYAEDQEGILSLVFVFHHMNESYAVLTGTTARGYEQDVSAYLLYEIAVALKEKGYRHLNLGGVPAGKKNAGIVHFKRSLGTDVIDLCEESTDFLLLPWTLFNPMLILRRNLPDRPFFRLCKKVLRKVMERILTPDSSIL
ncbi:MAG: GNAT family N-acetyltransferase [Bacteroidales bacterium]